jgi:hypothetical protein
MRNVFVWLSGVALVLVAFGRPVLAGDEARVPCSVVMPTAIPGEMAAVESIPDPVEYATKLLEEMAKERQASMAARDRLAKDGGNVEQTLQEIFAELGRLDRDLQVLHCQIGKGCYPFCLNGVQICNRAQAVRKTSTLMARSLALQAAVNLLEKHLEAGQNEADQIIACIDSLEASIVLVPYLTSRVMVQRLPSDSAQMLATLEAMLPKESPEIAAHRVRVAAFLASPLSGESQTAETQDVPKAVVQ